MFTKNNISPLYILFIFSILGACKSVVPVVQNNIALTKTIHPKAEQLYKKIQLIAKKGYAFGHQDATAYGVKWKNDGTIYRSDVNDVAGDFPAVYGFEIGHVELGDWANLDTVSFALMKNLIRKAHKNGGIITLSWHADNPASNKSSWHTKKAVKHILKGGRLHKKYKSWLSKVAYFVKDLNDDQGQPIPVVFRPFHEMNGSWFWWGKRHCTPQEYKQLWQETVFILNKELSVDQLLYAYSPNSISSKEEYLEYYPGDDFVDILGVDIYQQLTTGNFIKNLNTNIPILKEIGTTKNKPYALTETGLNKIRVKDWWTQTLDKNIAHMGLSWALFWRNARKNHHYAPYPGQKSSSDFVQFKELNHVLFLSDMKTLDE